MEKGAQRRVTLDGMQTAHPGVVARLSQCGCWDGPRHQRLPVGRVERWMRSRSKLPTVETGTLVIVQDHLPGGLVRWRGSRKSVAAARE